MGIKIIIDISIQNVALIKKRCIQRILDCSIRKDTNIEIIWGLSYINVCSVILIYNFCFFTMEKHQAKTGHKHLSKQNQQSISIFNYYLRVLFPTMLKNHTYPPKDYTKAKVLDRNIVYNYTYHKIMGIEGFS